MKRPIISALSADRIAGAPAVDDEPSPSCAAPGSVRPRTIHLVDAENHVFAFQRKAGVDDVATWWRLYRNEMVGIGPDDTVYIGVSVKNRWMKKAIPLGRNVFWAIGHAGPNGAEQALLASVYPAHAALRYDRVCIVSGDGAFVNFANRCSENGMTVQVVSVEGTTHPNLAAAATVHTTLRRVRRSQRACSVAAVQAIHGASIAAAVA